MAERTRPIPNGFEIVKALQSTHTATYVVSELFTPGSQLPSKREVLEAAKGLPYLSKFTRAMLGAYPTDTASPLSLSVGHRTLSLCTDAEPRLIRSLQNGSFLTGTNPETGVPHVLIKYTGKLAALCIADFTLPNGQEMKADHWYFPVDVDHITSLEQVFSEGDATSIPLVTGTWALMRPARAIFTDDGKRLHEVLREAFVKRVTETEGTPALIETDSGSPVSREAYRKMTYESIFGIHDTSEGPYRPILSSD